MANGMADSEMPATEQERDIDGNGGRRGTIPKLLSIVLVAILVLVLFAALAYGLANKTPATGRSGETRIGKLAPDFSMPLLTLDDSAASDGGEFHLRDAIGSPLVINFWASWCPPCREESPGFERMWRMYADRGVQIIGVDIQDTESAARSYIEEFGLTFPNGRDIDGRITIDYGVIGLPVTFFVNSAGIIEGRWVGAVSEDKLQEWIEALIAGTKPG